MGYRKLGCYIEQTDIRNTDLSVSLLLGVSIDKKFIPSIANTVGTDFSKYKIVKRNEFAYGPVTSRNGNKVSIALLQEADECIISSSYTSFRISKPSELSAEYLILLLSRPEFDRYARFNSWGSAREVFSWEDLCNTEFDFPEITEQIKIVNQYKAITNRIDVLDNICIKLERLAAVIYSKMIMSHLDELPPTWEIKELGDCGFDVSDGNYSSKYPKYNEFLTSGIPFIRGTDFNGRCISLKNALFISGDKHQELKKGHTKRGDILMTTRGYIGNIAYITDDLVDVNINSQLVRLNGNGVVSREYLAMSLLSSTVQAEIKSFITGSAQEQLPIKNLNRLHIVIPDDDTLDRFDNTVKPIISAMLLYSQEKDRLQKLSDLIC